MSILLNKPIICPILIGRQSELTTLHTLIAHAKSTQGQVVLISGEAGIGKSRLVAEANKYAKEQGFLLLLSNCFPIDRSSPYAPILDLLRSSQANELLATYTTNLVPPPSGVTQLPLLDPEQEKRRLFVAITHFFTDLAAKQPILFIVEDIHWSDETSLELLLYLARNCVHLPILFVLTYRSDEESSVLRHFLAECDRKHLARDFPLQRLTRAEVDAMLQAIFVQHQAAPTGLLESMYALTEGNPFFIEEMLKSLIATGEITDREGVWERTLLFGVHTRSPSIPRSVQDAVYQRTKQLSVSARRILTLAAVAGTRFNLAILQQVMQIEESHLLISMKELVAAQLVREEAPDQFLFRHALTRQAVYAELLAGERRALHRTIAETIEQCVSPTAILDAELVDLATHFYEAGVWTKAAAYGQRAGERALMLYAPRAALEHLTRTLDALSHLGRTPSTALLRARGQAYETIGAFEQAWADYQLALSIARQTEDGLAEWQSLLDIGFWWAGRDYAQAGEWFRSSLDLAQGLADPKLQARSLNRLGNWLVNTGRVADGLQSHQEALAIFETLQDQEGMAETFDLLGMANGIYGDTVQAVEQYDHAIAALRNLNDPHGLISSLTTRVAYASPMWVETTSSVCASPERCARDISEALHLARQVDSLTGQAYVEWNAGLAFASFGELGRGLAHAQVSVRIASEIQHAQWLAAAYFTLGRVYFLMLEANLAVQAFETGLALARDIGSAWWVGNITAYLARAYLLQGAWPRAESVLQAVMAREQQPSNSPERRVCWAWGELVLARGEAEIALGIADRLFSSAPGATRGQPIPWLLKLKGEALGALSRREEAIEALEEARRGALDRKEQPLLWQIHRALGRQYRRLRQEDLAQPAYTAAREGINSLAKAIDDGHLHEHFLQAAQSSLPREKPTSPNRTAKEAFGGLTEREREVVRLVAQGKSNGEIADALVVTKRTIETHISNILYKLNLTSRAQLVVWAIEKGLSTGDTRT